MPPLAIGIDLGTTNSVIARLDESGRAEVVPNAEGDRLTPSVIYFGSDPPSVGAAAKAMQQAGEEAIAAFFKRSMGDPNFLLRLGGRARTPVDLSALVLKKLKDDASLRLDTPVDRAVITVPAYFNDAQRDATVDAARQAGLEVLRIINEPTAAALAYRIDRSGREETLMVYDLGGGTFDISLVISSMDELKVVATAGDHNLGGKDWDDRIAAFLGQCFAEAHGVDPLDDPAVNQGFLVLAESAKKALTQRATTRVKINHRGSSLSVELARPAFEELTRDLMERTETLCEIVLRDAGRSWQQLTGVLLVGGSTNMPMVSEYVARMSGKPPLTGVDVDLAVGLGAAIMAGKILGVPAARRPGGGIAMGPVVDVATHSLGVIAASEDGSRFTNSILIKRNTVLPAQGEKDYKALIRRGGSVECNVYVTEGESDDPRAVAVSRKYVCKGVSSGPGKHANIRVSYAYDSNGLIQVRAMEQGSGLRLDVEAQPAGDLKWLSRSPCDLEDFDPTELKLAVTSPLFDNIGAILSSVGLSFQRYQTGRDHSEYNIVFLNCGSRDAVDPEALRRFVTGGGCVYASDHMDRPIAAAFPGLFEFGGHTGTAGIHEADVVDPELQSGLGKTIPVNFDMPGWTLLNSVSDEVRVLLRSRNSGMPLMVMAEIGEGTVFYTCFHNHRQATESETKLLQLLVLKQLSAAAGVPIEAVANSSKLVWRP